MLRVDELAKSLFLFFLLFDLLVKLFELSHENSLLFVLLLSAHKQLFVVALALDLLLIAERSSFDQWMIRLSPENKDGPSH